MTSYLISMAAAAVGTKLILDKRLAALKQAAKELYDVYHGFHMPDAPQRGEIDAAWTKLKQELDR